MTSMVLQPLKKAQQAALTAVLAAALAVSRAVSAAMAVIRSSILRVVRTAIWMISSEIFSGICLAAAEEAAAGGNGPMKGANIRKSIRITFEEAVFGCEKELDLILKDPCEA